MPHVPNGAAASAEPPPCHEDDSAGSTQGPTYETWTDREYVYHAAAGAQIDEFILQIDRTGAPMYMLQDAGLNVVGLVDQSGDIIRQDTYAPYGEIVATDHFILGFGHNHAGWKGLFFDRLVANAQGSQLTPGGVGLYRARNRTYSPTLGRWLQRDPNATAQPILEAAVFNGLAFSDFALRVDVPTLYGDGMNLFQFGRSNPIAHDDPLGLDLGFTYPGQLTVAYTSAELRMVDARISGLGVSLVFSLLLTDALVPDQQIQTLRILEQIDREWGQGGSDVQAYRWHGKKATPELARELGVDIYDLSDAIHRIKRAAFMRPNDDIEIETETGNVYDPRTGEEIGNIYDEI